MDKLSEKDKSMTNLIDTNFSLIIIKALNKFYIFN